jgi:translation initiation factor 1
MMRADLMGKKQKPGAAPAAAPERLPASPFAGLAALRDQLPPGQAKAGPTAQPARAPAPPRGPARAVVRYERKGRGGKEATVIEQLGLSAADLETWCRELKRALGCGGAVEEASIALAGDQRGRLPALLEARGVRRVTVS